ncbi:hypothetical protein XSR1_180009 [Xenorhabdus szentirmaii DSM 16338]|uniref:Uncharacterized protein n=1 Tax=Xenorhabdus szentirmaii DSM 16338 TaxID=1427518 RepID=W1IXP7_9GAMM|nr:hypothetical protein XSR1_180009 [Xenorhabdus szentirmaii DSM 16338]
MTTDNFAVVYVLPKVGYYSRIIPIRNNINTSNHPMPTIDSTKPNSRPTKK